MDIPNIFITSETKFYVIALDDLIKQIGEDSTKRILSFFECPQNKDVEDFLRYKAIEFSKQRLAKTYLVYWATIDYREKELVGYFTVSLKQISIDKKDLSNTKRKAYKKYAISCFLKQGGSMKVKVREAIRKALRYGSFVLYTGNGTQIRLLDTCNSPYDCIGKIKVVKGERIYRDIFCAVIKAPETQHMDVIERYSMYVPDDNGCSYFCDDEYTIPEKDMNLFISLNGGIDEYRTISLPAMMMSDASLIFGLG